MPLEGHISRRAKHAVKLVHKDQLVHDVIVQLHAVLTRHAVYLVQAVDDVGPSAVVAQYAPHGRTKRGRSVGAVKVQLSANSILQVIQSLRGLRVFGIGRAVVLELIGKAGVQIAPQVLDDALGLSG